VVPEGALVDSPKLAYRGLRLQILMVRFEGYPVELKLIERIGEL
jgi:hypothetical protein